MNIQKEIKKGIGIIKFIGDTHISSEKKLVNLIADLLAKTNNRLIIDFSECEFIDSCSIGIIILINKMILENGGKLCICNVKNDLIKSIFQSTRLDHLIDIHPTLEQALTKCFNINLED